MISIDISGVLKGVEADVNKMVDKLATDLFAGLKLSTPVDTGRARAGWELELNEGRNPVIQNMVPYIGVLNDGHSLQAPQNFVELEIAKVIKP